MEKMSALFNEYLKNCPYEGRLFIHHYDGLMKKLKRKHSLHEYDELFNWHKKEINGDVKEILSKNKAIVSLNNIAEKTTWNKIRTSSKLLAPNLENASIYEGLFDND